MNVVRPPLHLNECHFLDVTILIMKAKLFGKVNNAAIAMACCLLNTFLILK